MAPWQKARWKRRWRGIALPCCRQDFRSKGSSNDDPAIPGELRKTPLLATAIANPRRAARFQTLLSFVAPLLFPFRLFTTFAVSLPSTFSLPSFHFRPLSVSKRQPRYVHNEDRNQDRLIGFLAFFAAIIGDLLSFILNAFATTRISFVLSAEPAKCFSLFHCSVSRYQIRMCITYRSLKNGLA